MLVELPSAVEWVEVCLETGRVGCAESGVGGVAVGSVVGGSVVGDGISDRENLKCRQFLKFEILDRNFR